MLSPQTLVKYKLAIFDSDGTLADSLPWMRQSFNLLADRHGFRRVELHEYEHFRDLEGRQLLKELRLPLWKLPRVMADMRRLMSQQIDQFSLFPGIPDTLAILAGRGITLGVVSSNSESNVRHILGPKTASYFAYFACGASLFGKAARLRALVRSSGVPKDQCIYIGDEIRDAHAARAANIAFGAVGWGQHSPQTLQAHAPQHLFNHVEEIAPNLCPWP